METKVQKSARLPSGWKTKSIGETCDLVTGFPFKSKLYDETQGIKVLRGENVSIGFLRWDTIKRWKHSTKGLEKYFLQKDDVVIGMDGSRVGKNRAKIQTSDLPLILAQRVARLRAVGELNQDYLAEIILHKKFEKYVEAVHTGTSIPHISGDQIKDFVIAIPPLDEQKAIASVLSAFTAKIRINQRMNQLLEAVGGVLFRRWFVDFEFPNQEGKPYRSTGGKMQYNKELDSEIPAGWEVKPIDEVSDFLNGLALQKFPAREGEDYLPVIKIRELRQGITESSDKANLDVPKEYVVNDGDILFSWSGSLDVVIWGYGKGALNQHLFKVTSKKYPKWFFYHWLLRFLPEYRAIASDKATTMGHIQRHHLSASKVLVPDGKTLEKMDKVLSPIMERRTHLQVESRLLAEIRDLLLPRLMSGKIRVPLNKEK